MTGLTRRDWLAVSASLPWAALASGQGTEKAQAPVDARLGPPKTLNDHFPFEVPKTLAQWQTRREQLCEQLQTALGLWPVHARGPMTPSFGKRIEREGYTVEHVRFESMPGHSVTGSLYKPSGAGAFGGEQLPGVLFAHGHWADGRLHVESDAAAKKLVEHGAEPDLDTAKFFMQHLPALFARHGMVVFAFDMVGYAESTAIGHVAKSGVPHANGFATVDCELHAHSLMGLQIFNCLRSLDFLESLHFVDSKRLGMTGASGGGTQTFLTAAIDSRIAVAAPAVMVSTAMQGGCVCENCSGLRVGTGNVEIAAMIAPRPLALTAANDWTKDLMTQGYPELQRLYELHGMKDNVIAKAWPQFPHNFNHPARVFVLEWFLKHFKLDPKAKAFPFQPIPIDELKVPATLPESNAAAIHNAWKALDQKALAQPTLHVTLDALRAMVCDELGRKIVIRKGPVESKVDGCTVHRAWLGRPNEKDALPSLGIFSKAFQGEKVLVWVHPDGIESLFAEGKVAPAARSLIDAGFAVLSGDLLGTGALAFDKPRPVNNVYAGFTWGYNRPLLAERVHDAFTLIAFANTILKAKSLYLAGWKSAGPWAALAGTLASGMEGIPIEKCAIDAHEFDFAKIKNMNDPMMLPGALKYGGLPGFVRHNGITTLVHNSGGTWPAPPAHRMAQDYRAEKMADADVTAWLLKPGAR